MIKVKQQPSARIQQRLTKIKEGPKWGALTTPHFGADGLVVTESDSDQYGVLGRRPVDQDACQHTRRTL